MISLVLLHVMVEKWPCFQKQPSFQQGCGQPSSYSCCSTIAFLHVDSILDFSSEVATCNGCLYCLNRWYCWCKKSCTSWYGKYPIIYKASYMLGGAGFPPSTVVAQTIQSSLGSNIWQATFNVIILADDALHLFKAPSWTKKSCFCEWANRFPRPKYVYIYISNVCFLKLCEVETSRRKKTLFLFHMVFKMVQWSPFPWGILIFFSSCLVGWPAEPIKHATKKNM